MPNVDEINRSHDVASSRACTALTYATPVYALQEDAVLSPRNEENSWEIIS